MIIQCENCARKFIVKDTDIPDQGRDVQCGFCSVFWHQMPVSVYIKSTETQKIDKTTKEVKKNISSNVIKASDGKTYKFLGSQWAQVLPSGKTGIFAKKKIGQELNKITGKKAKKISGVKIDPSSLGTNNSNQLPDVYRSKKGLGFLGYIFLIIIISLSIIGIIKTFEDTWLNYFPQDEYIFELLDVQLEYIAETFKNFITIAKDLYNSY
jgi:predicted Zn finger-like uncharacterized protein